MAFETATPVAREQVRRRLSIAYAAVQLATQSETVTAAQAVKVDAALLALTAAMAGVVPVK